jgi:primosomal protein N' (replication factor Y)
LGPTDDVPDRVLPVMRRVSPIRFFDESGLALARWMSERYVAPLATVLGRLSPPRVAGEEPSSPRALDRDPVSRPPGVEGALPDYAGAGPLLDALAGGAGGFVVRPAPDDEAALAVDAVARCLAGGRRALVLVPEASPLPATAAALAAAFGDRLCLFVGGDARERYRRWLAIHGGAFDVVVGTRPAVFAPIRDLGLVYVSRESHAAHREDRAPYYHVRDVALRRAQTAGGVCVLAALCPSGEAAALGLPQVRPGTRRWPKVEVVRPGPEGRAPRAVQALRDARRAFVFAPLPGYGVAQVCRTCGAPAVCGACGGTLRLEEGVVRCIVCVADGRCASCGGSSFGIRRGGQERVEEWVRQVATVPVVRPSRPRLPRPTGEIVVGGPEEVRDLGAEALDVVVILDADLAARRPGLAARERALAVWMEAAAWAGSSGRVVVVASHANDPAIQALVRGNPDRFHAREATRRADAGFPVGAAVFRVVGGPRLPEEIAGLGARTALVSGLGERTVCLLAFDPARVPAFGAAMRALAADGVVDRVEAEPHL